MLLKGDVYFNGIDFRAAFWSNGSDLELCLVHDGYIRSSYKVEGRNEFMYGDNKAREIYRAIKAAETGTKSCKKANIGSAPLQGKGIQKVYTYKRKSAEYTVSKFGNLISGVSIEGDELNIDLTYAGEDSIVPKTLEYVLIKVIKDFDFDDTTGEVAPEVKSLAEISMEKEGGIGWLKSKRYYIIDTPAMAEKIIKFLETYKGPIAYDTETTGLRINMFGKYGGKYRLMLDEFNSEKENEEDKIRVDKLVGIIFSYRPDESFYFPVGHRFIQNLYDKDQKNSTFVDTIVESMKSWAKRKPNKDFANYINGCKEREDYTADALLMHRCRKVLEEGHLLAHNGTFEWKVGYLYDIITNIKEDTMILHQLMYKFRSGVDSGGESSSLKFLTHKEFKVNTLELTDFFTGYHEQTAELKGKKAEKSKKKKGSHIDFSYMDYDGTKAYAPADGDFTFQLFIKYKRDLKENHPELDYLYNIELVVSQAIAYMEFSGHRIDAEKIENVRIEQVIQTTQLEYGIRELAKLNADAEKERYKVLEEKVAQYKEASANKLPKEEVTKLRMIALEESQSFKQMLDESENPLNLGSPKQLCELFYDKLKIPFKGDKPSVGKKVLKAFTSMKDENGNPKYPIVGKYREWKDTNTLITKFFDNLQNFMYPGGFIFSSYGQISTATGRMSCKGPKALGSLVVTLR